MSVGKCFILSLRHVRDGCELRATKNAGVCLSGHNLEMVFLSIQFSFTYWHEALNSTGIPQLLDQEMISTPARPDYM